jgi:murein DD-endopeptidase MepM/ murein hydrolase activator NlpD
MAVALARIRMPLIYLTLALMPIDSFIRDLPRWPLFGLIVVGNHVVLDLGDGVFAAFADLRRGSIRVRRGDRVRLGQQMAECGNSRNSTEPHLHFQLMDHPSVLLAAGLPMRFRDLEGARPDGPGLPRKLRPFTVPGPGPAPSTAPAGPSGDGRLETRVPA